MTCPSKATIYHLELTVLVERNKHRRTFKTWAVSCFTDPLDLMRYDNRTVSRIMREGYRNSRAKRKPLRITKVTVLKELGKSCETLDDKKGPDSSSYK